MPSATEAFVKGLQSATGKDPFRIKFWDTFPEKSTHTFQDALDHYADYFASVPSEQQEEMSTLFWEQIKALGTPIIEETPDDAHHCAVYFLLPKDKILDSQENHGEKKDVYLQGDFHGYDTTVGRQRVKEFNGTGIMLKKDLMPKDAMVTYRYIQLEQSLRGKTPTQHHGGPEVLEAPPAVYFPTENPNVKAASPEQRKASKKASELFWGDDSQIKDEYSHHRPAFLGISSPERIFRINPNAKQAQLSGEIVNWSTLLAPPDPGDSPKRFAYHNTHYSTINQGIQPSDPLLRQASPSSEDLFSDSEDSNYADCTRSIHTFKPTSGTIDNVVVVNDGMAYLSMGIMQQFEAMVEKGRLSPNTAFVFVTPLPGLMKTLSSDDPKINMPGMGSRTIDYEHGIEDYAAFISDELFPALSAQNVKIPDSASNRVMIGSSLSGTASLYMAERHAELFGNVIVQSPSASNRSILRDLVLKDEIKTPKVQVHLSCGVFEQPGYAANTNFPYAKKLSEKLGLELHEGSHGHQFLAWTEALEDSLPNTMLTSKLELSLPVTRLKPSMVAARIPGVSIALINTQGTVSTEVLGYTDVHANPKEVPVKPESVFGAASLSKPVFSYLVLKLIDNKKLADVNEKPFDLHTPLSDILPLEAFYQSIGEELSASDAKLAKSLTAKMILSHTSGISDRKTGFASTPGTAYDYSGMALVYLQKVIKKHTGKSLEALAQEEVFTPLSMQHSSFIPPKQPDTLGVNVEAESKTKLVPPLSANSLHTTASDYATLMSAWMQDPSELMESAFQPQVSLTNDKWALDRGVSEEDCSHLAWGLGIGLELDEAGKSVKAFHMGDMNQWRGWVAMDLDKKSASVYFANGHHEKDANAHVLSDLIIMPKIKLAHASRWFFQKFGFARDVEPGWQERENTRMWDIGQYLSSAMPEQVDIRSSHAKILASLPTASEFHQSIVNHAVTSGRDANCFFQSFMHTLSAQSDETLEHLQREYSESVKTFVDTFNKELSLEPPVDFNKIIAISRALHPLERECVFGPILRRTYNAMIEKSILLGESLEQHSEAIVLANQTVAFSNAFGADYAVHMSEEQLALSEQRGMPKEAVERTKKTRFEVDGRVFYSDHPPDQHFHDTALFDLDIIYADVHLNYTLGTPALNAVERRQVETQGLQTQDGVFAIKEAEGTQAPLAQKGLSFSNICEGLRDRFHLTTSKQIESHSANDDQPDSPDGCIDPNKFVC